MSDQQHTVKIHFTDKKKAEGFLQWLCNSGEQDYFQQKEYGNIEVVSAFEYHAPQDEQYPKNDARRYANSKFGGEDGLTANAID